MRRSPPLTLALVLVGLGAVQNPPPPVTEPDAYAVYALLIPLAGDHWFAEASRLVILEQTGTFPGHASPPRGCVPSGPDWQPVVEDYNHANAEPRSLEARFSFKRPIVLLPPHFANLGGLAFEPREWAHFVGRFPDSKGFYILSAVGFDATRTRAMAYVGHVCGWGCGAGRYYFLEKGDGRWQVALPDNLPNDCTWAASGKQGRRS